MSILRLHIPIAIDTCREHPIGMVSNPVERTPKTATEHYSRSDSHRATRQRPPTPRTRGHSTTHPFDARQMVTCNRIVTFQSIAQHRVVHGTTFELLRLAPAS